MSETKKPQHQELYIENSSSIMTKIANLNCLQMPLSRVWMQSSYSRTVKGAELWFVWGNKKAGCQYTQT